MRFRIPSPRSVFGLVPLLLVISMPLAWAQDCSVFSESFGSPPIHSWEGDGADWAFSGGRLRATNVGDSFAYAETAFMLSESFQLDVDIELNDTSGKGMVGIYPFASGDVFLDIGGGSVVDGVAAVLFASGNAYLLGWDVIKGEWFQSQPYKTTGQVTSIGVLYGTDEIVLRINGSNTPLKVTGEFELVPMYLSTLWLMVQGNSSTTAYFDNICGSPLTSGPGPTPSNLAAEPLIFPYYQATGGSFTGFAISNYSNSASELQFRAYGKTGALLNFPGNPRTIILGAGKQLAQLGHEIFQTSPTTAQQGWVEVSADNAQLGSFFQVGMANRLDGSVSVAGGERNLYFTRIYEGRRTFRGRDVETFLSLVNPGTSSVTIELALKDTGSDRSVSRTLPAKGCLYGTVSELFGRSMTISQGFLSVRVTAGNGVAGFALLKVPESSTWIGSMAASPNPTTRLYSAQLASVPGLFTSVSLVNTGSQTRKATLHAVAEDGGALATPVTVNLSAGESFQSDASEIFGWPASQSKIGSLKIEVNGPDVVGDIIFGDSAKLASAASLPLQTHLLTEGVFSQVANGLGLFTGLAFYNPGDAAAQITMEVYREDGTSSGKKTFTLNPGRRISQLLVEYLPQTQGQIRGYVRVTSSQPLVAQQLFGASTLLSAVPPTVAPQAITGPSGSYIEVADQSTAGGIQVGIQSESIATVQESGEKAMSGGLRVTVNTKDPVQGDDFHKISIPLTSTPADPDKLTAKVRLTTGTILPVSGVYNAARNTYTVEVPALIDGWIFGVVESSVMSRVPLDRSTDASPLSEASPAGWMTPVDWITCEFHPIRHVNTMTDAQIKRDYLPSMWDACKALSWARFRSPKLWIASKWNNTELDPPGRIVHITEAKSSLFQGNWDEEDANFSTDDRTEEEMLSLGQIYIKPSQLTQLNADYGVNLGNIFVHELFHSVQFGYDFRRGAVQVGNDWETSYKAYTEGTASPLGQTFQKQAGEIEGPKIYVRELHDGEYTPLDEPIDNNVANYYRKQDFWAWVARQYGGHSWAYTNQVFEQMGLMTYGEFNKTNDEYLVLYRKGTDEAFRSLFGKGYSEIYTEFALDRAYKHSASALLRQSESDNWKANNLADSLFRAAGKKQVDPASAQAAQRQAEFTGLKPLTTVIAQVAITADLSQKGSVPLKFEVSGGELKAGGVQITVFKENSQGIMTAGGEVKVSNSSSTVNVPISTQVKRLTILISNTYLENKTVRVKVSVESDTGCGGSTPVILPGERKNFEIRVLNTADVKDCPPWEDSSMENVFRRVCVYFQNGSIQGKSETCYSHPQTATGTYNACDGSLNFEFQLLGTIGTWADWKGTATGTLQDGKISGTWSGTQSFEYEGEMCQRTLSGTLY